MWDSDHHFMTGDLLLTSPARVAIVKTVTDVDLSFALSLDISVIGVQRRNMKRIFFDQVGEQVIFWSGKHLVSRKFLDFLSNEVFIAVDHSEAIALISH
ncbi:hypothetical protein MXAZACID_17576 [Acidocella sp. MX-AZ02]|nr:hypothetical protein MXAZACID_17576 [Acidocella sp. MX-AZ02]